MAKLGIVSEEQFAQELNNSTTKSVVSTVIHPTLDGIVEQKRDRGRGKGNNEVPENLRKLIGEESIINGREAAIELAKDFGISESSVSAYTKGSTSTASYNNPDQTLQNYLAARKARASKKALRTLNKVLDHITPEKLEGIKARDLSSIAKDMSVVAKNMSPDNSQQTSDGPKFVVYAPTIRDERSYETVIVSDNY